MVIVSEYYQHLAWVITITDSHQQLVEGGNYQQGHQHLAQGDNRKRELSRFINKAPHLMQQIELSTADKHYGQEVIDGRGVCQGLLSCLPCFI